MPHKDTLKRLHTQMYVPHVRSFNKAYIILVILSACLSRFCMCAEVKRAGVPLSLKETALWRQWHSSRA